MTTSSHHKQSIKNPDIGSLKWAKQTGGKMTWKEKSLFVLQAIPNLSNAFVKRIFLKHTTRVDLTKLAPPNTAIVNEAIELLKKNSSLPMINHCFRTGYWTLAVMQRDKLLTHKDIEEAWIAALLHDIGLDLPPQFGEFTLGSVNVVHELALKYGWDKDSEQRSGEAITVNPNSYVNKNKYGLLAWAMNVGGFGETFLGPYRILMHPDNIRELESLYPRDGFHSTIPEIIDKELKRFPNQRFALLRKVGFLNLRLRD